MQVLIVQYIRPAGEKRRVIVDMDDELITPYRAMLEMGRFFTLEQLPRLADGTFQFSLCIDDGDQDVDIRIINIDPPYNDDKLTLLIVRSIEEMLETYL